MQVVPVVVLCIGEEVEIVARLCCAGLPLARLSDVSKGDPGSRVNERTCGRRFSNQLKRMRATDIPAYRPLETALPFPDMQPEKRKSRKKKENERMQTGSKQCGDPHSESSIKKEPRDGIKLLSSSLPGKVHGWWTSDGSFVTCSVYILYHPGISPLINGDTVLFAARPHEQISYGVKINRKLRQRHLTLAPWFERAGG